MTDHPLYDLLESYRDPISPMAEYLRDKDRPRGHVEARRKQELRQVLTDFREGRVHPIIATLMAIETVLSATRHPLHHYAELAKDPTSFTDYLGAKKTTPEEFQARRKAHINKLVAETINSFHDPAWIQELLDSLDDPNSKAVDIVERLATRMIITGGVLRERSETQEALKKRRRDDELDALQHPNDQYIEGDLLSVFDGYKLLDWTESEVRDQYLTDKAIEDRRMGGIVDVLTAWKNGRHPLLVIADLMAVTLENLENPYRSMIGSIEDEMRAEKNARREGQNHPTNEYYLVSLLLKQDDLRRQAREILRQMREPVAAYRSPASNPDLAAQIDGYMDQITANPLSSFDMIRSIAGAIFTDGAKELVRISTCLQEKADEEEKARVKRRPMGTLKTETEDEMKERLKDIFARRAAATEPSPKLTREIRIEPAGSGMIKPYPPTEDDGGWEEDLYGTVTARITTYAVSLVPMRPDLTDALAARVKQALEEIADVEPAFAIPFDHASEPYERPFKPKKYDNQKKYYSIDSLHVEVNNGVVKVHTHLDLDDIWNLYYLLEDVIEPSDQIAAAMNGARYAEARGVLLCKGDGMDSNYSNRSFRPEQRLGSLENEAPEDYLVAGLRDTFALYAINEIAEEQFMHRMITLGDHVLMGQLVDPSGTFLPLQRLIAQAEEKGTDVVTYDDALKGTVKKMLMLVAGVTDENTPLDRALADRVREVGDKIRETMQSDVRRQEDARWERSRRLWDGPGRSLDEMWADLKKDFAERAGPEEAKKIFGDDAAKDGPKPVMSEEEAKEDLRRLKEEKAQEEEERKRNSRALARKANLAFRNGDIGATTDRTWRRTTYVSRSPGSIWVRKELPSSLRAFTSAHTRGDMKSMIMALTSP